MSKTFLGVIAAIIIVAVGLGIWQGSGHNQGSGKPTNHIKGSTKTGVTLVEYGDYQCPACGEFYQTVKDVNAKYDGLIQFQFRNFPLVQIHPNTFAASRAAEAAGLQGKYWQMHDLLYTENTKYYVAQQEGSSYNTWINASDPTTYFNQYAQQLGLNVTKFKKDYSSAKVNNWIQADKNKGKSLGVNGTPTFYLDGQQLSNNQLVEITNGQQVPSVDAFSKLINAAIKKKTGHAPSKSELGTSPSSSPSQQAPSGPIQTKAKQ